MALLLGLLKPFEVWNDVVLRIGRVLAIIAIAVMVLAILVQVFFRYALNNALPWPDEAARFLMLWMTGLLAPMAFRRGGFVAIDTLPLMLPSRLTTALSLVLLLISAFVLAVGVRIAWSEVTGFGATFSTSSLYVPFAFGDGVCEALGAKQAGATVWCRVPRLWAFLSLFVGVVLLLIVNLELILRALVALLGGADRLKPLSMPEEELMAE